MRVGARSPTARPRGFGRCERGVRAFHCGPLVPVKAFTVLLAVSLVANAALATLLLRRPPAAAPRAAPSVRSPGQSSTPSGAEAQRAEALLAALAGSDTAAMIAAGVPADVARHLAAARAFARLAAISRAMDGASDTTEYWRRSHRTRPQPTRDQRTERLAAEREFAHAMREAFGDGWNDDSRSHRYSFLSRERQAQLIQIERDYEEMQQAVGIDSADVQLASDRERQKLLQQELQRDLDAALTPAERAEVQRRTSHSARQIIDQFGDILTSEEEYARLYALRNEFDDRFNAPGSSRTPEAQRQRAEAERKLNDDLRAAVGEERWGAVSPSHDREYHALATVTTRLGLPSSTPDLIYAVRETYAAQSLALHQDTALTEAARRAQLAALATRAKDELRTKLGQDGAEAYVPHAGWVQAMHNGTAFVTQARLLPPGTARPTGTTSFYLLPPKTAPAPIPKR